MCKARWAQLLLLAIAAGAANYTRTALGPLQEAVRVSLSLSDNQIALLQGFAVAAPLALVSLPIGLLADQLSRKRILLISLACAVAASACGAFAPSFILLMSARFVGGLALPGIYICAYAMASDLVSPQLRGRATTIVGIGEVSGPPAAFALGGTLLVAARSVPWVKLPIRHGADWSSALLWMSVIEVPIFLLLLLWLREPARRELSVVNQRIGRVWRELWHYRALVVPLQLARATLFIADGAVYVWSAPLLERRFHLGPDRIGVLLGTALLVGGLAGPMLGGPLVDFCNRRGGPRRAMNILALVGFLAAPLSSFALLPNAAGIAVVLCIFLTVCYAIGAGALALTLIVIPGELRGLNIGISLVVGALFFVGLAPLAVSGLSGALGGEGKVGEALAIVCGTASALTAACLWVIGSCSRDASFDPA